MSKFLLSVLALCLFVFVSCNFVSAQSGDATLSGTITDQNSAAIPGVKVTITDPATGLERVVTTNDSGSFTINFLKPSIYSLLAEATGFKRIQLTGIVLNVGDQKGLNMQLEAGDVTGVVEVTADPTLIRTDGSVGTVVDRQFVQNIPLNGRSFQSLLELTPGVVITSAGNPALEGGQFSVNGQRTSANYFTVDGVSVNAGINSTTSNFAGQAGSGQLPALTASGTTSSLVSVDALQEFRIQTSSYAPEFGRTPGGQVQLATRSGGNDLHGSMFDYIRNDVFDANDWFANRNRLPKPPVRQNQFGGTLSGPIFFPNFGDGGSKWYDGRNRTFFFFSYEGLRLRQPKASETVVPNLCMRGRGSCTGGQQPAPSFVRPFIDALPLPTGPDLVNSQGVPTGFAQLAVGYSDPSSFDATAVRVDHSFGNVSVFGRVSHTPSYAKTRLLAFSYSNVTSQRNTNMTGGATWTLMKKIVNDLRANFLTNAGPFYSEVDDFGGAVPLQNHGFLGRSPDNSRFQFVLLGGGEFASGALTEAKQRQLNIVDNLIVTAGDHQLKFGADYRRINPLLNSGGDGGSESVVVNPANFSLATQYLLTVTDKQRHAVAFDNLSLYAQDTWRLNPRFTLTYGVRWEFVPPPHATEGGEALTVDGLENPFQPNNVGFAPLGTSLWKTQYYNFAPRVGASVVLNESAGRQLVVRGGVGIFYDLGLGNSANGYVSYPYSLRKIVTNTPFPLTPAALALPVLGVDPPPFFYVLDRGIVLPRTYQWNVSAEQSIGAHQTLTASYIGAEGRDLLKNNIYNIRFREWANLTPTTQLVVQRNLGHSDYHALQLQFQRRLSRGLQALASYTFGRSRDTASSDSGAGLPNEKVSHELDYGFSDFDVRHNLTTAITYQFPNLRSSPIVKALTSDWGIDIMFRARTGFPINITTSIPFPPGNETVRPNLIPDIPIYVDDPLAPGGRRFNTATPTSAQVAAAGCVPLAPASNPTNAKGAFCTPQPGTQGSLPRGLVRGFGAKQIDLALRREFRTWESVRLQVRFEAFNVFNWPNFSNPNGTLTSANFGLAGQMLNRSLGGLSALYQIGGPRSMQASIKILF